MQRECYPRLAALRALSSAASIIKPTNIAAKARHTRLTTKISKRLGFIGHLTMRRALRSLKGIYLSVLSKARKKKGVPASTVNVGFRPRVRMCQVPDEYYSEVLGRWRGGYKDLSSLSESTAESGLGWTSRPYTGPGMAKATKG
jgi:hypothetical protein